MTVLEKAYVLSDLLATAKARNDEFSSNIAWGSPNVEEIQKDMENLIKDTIRLFSGDENARIFKLDYDIREATIAKINAKLDEALMKFPEYNAISKNAR